MKDNPFQEWRNALDAFETDVRERRAEMHEARDDIAVELLKEGHAVKKILEWYGTKNPNWIFTACANRGLGTPAQIRREALDNPNRETLVRKRVPGGYLVTDTGTEEEATFIWEPEAGAYTPKDTNVNRGSELHDVVKRFGAGLLPFPYTP